MSDTSCTAFDGMRRIAAGPLAVVALKARAALERGRAVVIFDDGTGEVVDVDYRGTDDEVVGRLRARVAHASIGGEPEAPRGPGRPRLGVVAREVTLLPRHWAWLNGQPGGASVALRRLVDEARKANVGRDRVRRAQEVAYRVMSALAGNLPGFEDASRALFVADADRFAAATAAWPADVRAYTRRLAQGAFA